MELFRDLLHGHNTKFLIVVALYLFRGTFWNASIISDHTMCSCVRQDQTSIVKE